MKSPHPKLRKLAAVALLCGSAAALSSCIMGEDSDPPILSVDFYWEDQDAGRHSDDTCDSADVRSMDWQLVNADGKTVDERDGTCRDGFNFKYVDPGSYTLNVNGYDADHNKQWQGSCELFLDRFDRAYPCNVSRVQGDSPD